MTGMILQTVASMSALSTDRVRVFRVDVARLAGALSPACRWALPVTGMRPCPTRRRAWLTWPPGRSARCSTSAISVSGRGHPVNASLRGVEAAAAAADVEVLVTPGNHEDWGGLIALWANPRNRGPGGSGPRCSCRGGRTAGTRPSTRRP
jgi:hypothetical protein